VSFQSFEHDGQLRAENKKKPLNDITSTFSGQILLKHYRNDNW
jgi:hypothetical protein